jgi:hypothetical protein
MKFDANSRERERERELEKEERERGRCESVDYRKMKGKNANNKPFLNFVKIKKNPLAFAS